MTNRVSGSNPPEPGRSQQDTKAQRDEKLSKVEKVREVDPDEQAKQRRRDQFRMMMDDTGETEEAPQTSPSPYEPKFYQSAANPASLPNADEAAVSGPSVSPPPNVNAAPGAIPSDDTDLPQSESFWNDFNLPDQPISHPVLEQKTALPSNSRGKDSPLVKGGKGKKEEIPAPPADKKKKEDEPRFSSQGTAPEKGKKALEPSPFSIQKPDEKKSSSAPKNEAAPTGRYWTPEEEIKGRSPKAGSFEETESDEKSAPILKKSDRERLEDREKPASIPERRFAEAEPQPQAKSKDKDKEERRQGSGDKHPTEIAAPSLPALPADIQPYAMAAATHASPYLSPEVLPLFYQMVGSIMIMTMPQGMSRTEILLNAPSFANSKFYGATIEIIKYSTAPDSLNIRLTGSNAAVKSFQENIPSLTAAFQSGNFNFRIGRLEASYSSDRPIFRRKEERRGGDFDQGTDSGSEGRR